MARSRRRRSRRHPTPNRPRRSYNVLMRRRRVRNRNQQKLDLRLVIEHERRLRDRRRAHGYTGAPAIRAGDHRERNPLVRVQRKSLKATQAVRAFVSRQRVRVSRLLGKSPIRNIRNAGRTVSPPRRGDSTPNPRFSPPRDSERRVGGPGTFLQRICDQRRARREEMFKAGIAGSGKQVTKPGTPKVVSWLSTIHCKKR